ncbi:MAG: hypothetical protein K6C06_00790 [Lachnospiraceae bacterium]|nr:hypothetical protein [Lachnospiraceae bacterium]
MSICGNCFHEITEGVACGICGYNNAENTNPYPIRVILEKDPVYRYA